MRPKAIPLDSPEIRFKDSEVSTLTNAAKISHLVNEITIGALSNKPKENEESDGSERSEPTISPPVKPKSIDPWKRDVWRSVDIENEKKKNRGNAITMIDCQAIRLKMAMRNVEKNRQKQVRMEMAQQRVKFLKLDEMMQKLKIDLTEKSEQKMKKNLLMKEEEVLRVVQQLDEIARIADEETKQETEEYNRKMTEKINRLKRVEEIRGYFQSLKSTKDMFIILFEKFVETTISNQQIIKNYEEFTTARDDYLVRYENVIKIVNSGQISATEVETLDQICEEIKEMQIIVDKEISSAEELERTIADRNEKLRIQEEEKQKENARINEELSRQLQQQKEQETQHQQTQQQSLDAVDTSNILTAASSHFVSNERLNHYRTIMKFYEEYTQSVKPLQNDGNIRNFRFDCQKGVNILLNTISAVSPKHLQDKFDRLALILSGNAVTIGGVQLITSQHPLGIRFVSLLVAKRFVKLADTTVSSDHRAAFPIASLIVAIWQMFPDVGSLVLAYFYKECPYLVPYFIQRVEGQSNMDYLKSIGFHFTDNVPEEHLQFLKRLTGLIRLYSAVIVSKLRRGVKTNHPHGIENAWIWLTNVLNLEPIPDVSSTMVYTFLVTAGADMWRTYGKQFVKLLYLIYSQYLVKLNDVDTEKAPKSRLEGWLSDVIKQQKIEMPTDLLAVHFWC